MRMNVAEPGPFADRSHPSLCGTPIKPVAVWFAASKVPTKIAVWIMALAFGGILVAAAFVMASKVS